MRRCDLGVALAVGALLDPFDDDIIVECIVSNLGVAREGNSLELVAGKGV